MLIALMAGAIFSPVIGGVNSRHAGRGGLENQRQAFLKKVKQRSVIRYRNKFSCLTLVDVYARGFNLIKELQATSHGCGQFMEQVDR
jgi:hypothetical protein